MRGRQDTSGITESINNASLGLFHYKTLLISGMGFLTDAYDLFIISTVLSLLPLAGWSISVGQTALIGSISLLSAVIGSSMFGVFLDKFGRKSVYGIELILLIGGALGSAFATPFNNVYILAIWRFLLGLGIGGDYAASSVIMSEYSNTKNRGRLLGMVFSMQSIGLALGPLIALGLISSGLSAAIVWRLLLAIGAIPSAIVIYYRRKMPETPKYAARVKGNIGQIAGKLKNYTGLKMVARSRNSKLVKANWKTLFTDRRLLLILLATAGTWFAMDWSFYGNTIMGGNIYKALIPTGLSAIQGLILHTKYEALIFGVGALPGYWLAAFTIDRLGRKFIQMLGFAMMAVLFFIIYAFPFLAAAQYIFDFIIIYGLSYFFVEFGPNMTTFIYPPEVFPVSLRGLGSGLAAAGGKIGAFIGTAVDAFLFAQAGGIGKVMLISVILSIIGLLLTIFILPETKQRDIEDTSQESRFQT